MGKTHAHACVHVHAHTQCGSLPHLGSDTQPAHWLPWDPNLPSFWHLDSWAPEATAPLWLLIQTPHTPCTPTLTPVAGNQTPVNIRELEMAFNKRTGKTALTACYGQTCTDQPPVYVWPAPFILLFLYFCMLVPPQSTLILPFFHL